MKLLIKRLMRGSPAIFNPLWSFTYTWVIHRDEKYIGDEYTDRLEAFRTIYRENRWASSESVSGRGSTLAYTAALRKSLARCLSKLKVETFLDATCDDFNWMQCAGARATSAAISFRSLWILCSALMADFVLLICDGRRLTCQDHC
jgi:hypothetical protein